MTRMSRPRNMASLLLLALARVFFRRGNDFWAFRLFIRLRAIVPSHLLRNGLLLFLGEAPNIDNVSGSERPEERLHPGHDSEKTQVTHHVDRFGIGVLPG